MFKQFISNNLKVFFYPTKHSIANARIIAGSGSFNEVPKNYGCAHYLEHMFFKGTKQRDYKKLNDTLSLLGDVNAYTSTYNTCYHFSFLSNKFKDAMNILLEMVFEPSFPEDEFEKERGVILQEYQTSLDDPSSYFWHKSRPNVTGEEHGHPILGTEETISNMTIQQIRDFHHANYNNIDNLILAVTGDISEEDLLKYLDSKGDLFNSLAASNRKPLTSPEFDTTPFKFTNKSKQAMFQMVFQAPSFEESLDKNYESTNQVLNNGLGQGMHSLLFNRIREELGLCYHIGCFDSANLQFGRRYIYSMLDEVAVDLAVSEINKVLDEVKKEGFSENLLNVAKENAKFTLASSVQTAKGINSRFDSYFNDCKGWDDSRNINELIDVDAQTKRIDTVTNNDIIELANVYFSNPSKLVVMTEEK